MLTDLCMCVCVCLQRGVVYFETIPCKANSTVQTVEFEDFRDFGDSKYKISISKCQQLALSVANGRVPLPSQQLELANQKREKVPRSSHVLTKYIIFQFVLGSIHLFSTMNMTSS